MSGASLASLLQNACAIRDWDWTIGSLGLPSQFGRVMDRLLHSPAHNHRRKCNGEHLRSPPSTANITIMPNPCLGIFYIEMMGEGCKGREKETWKPGNKTINVEYVRRSHRRWCNRRCLPRQE